MFIHHVEFWLHSYPEHAQEYMQEMLEDGKLLLTDWEDEVKLLTTKMAAAKDVDMIEYTYLWSVRDYLQECIRWYKET